MADRKDNGQFNFGNKFSQKKWKTPEDLEKYIDEYFESLGYIEIEEVSAGKIVKRRMPVVPMIEGLANHLETSRKTLLQYEKDENYLPYSNVIKRAKQKIVEKQGQGAFMNYYNPHFAKFALINNSDYKEKITQENEGGMSITIKREGDENINNP